MFFCALVATTGPALAGEVGVDMVLGTLPVAGFGYYDGPKVWKALAVGDVLELEREADNPFDARAVRVQWRGHKLGYVPRAGNETIARLLDRGVPLSARIVHLQPGRSLWARVMFELSMRP